MKVFIRMLFIISNSPYVQQVSGQTMMCSWSIILDMIENKIMWMDLTNDVK
jgi:hypothetical protein